MTSDAIQFDYSYDTIYILQVAELLPLWPAEIWVRDTPVLTYFCYFCYFWYFLGKVSLGEKTYPGLSIDVVEELIAGMQARLYFYYIWPLKLGSQPSYSLLSKGPSF